MLRWRWPIGHKSRRLPAARQLEATDCGAAALLTVLRHWGGDSTLTRVRELAGTDHQGTSLAQLVVASHKLGLSPRAVRGSLAQLLAEALPAIVHVTPREGYQHYLVLYGVSKGDTLLFHDPSTGALTLTMAEFGETWTGKALLLLPTDTLAREPTLHWMKWLLSQAMAHEVLVAQSGFLAVAYTCLVIGSALFVQLIVDKIIPTGDLHWLLVLGGSFAIVQVLRGTIQLARQRFLLSLATRLHATLARSLVAQLFLLHHSFSQRRTTGEMATRWRDVAAVQGTIQRILASGVSDLFLVVFGASALLYLARPAGLLAVVALPLLAWAVSQLAKRLETMQGPTLSYISAVEAAFLDSVAASSEARAFGASDAFVRRLEVLNSRSNLHLERLGAFQATIAGVAESTTGIVLVATMMLGATLAVGEQLDVGEVMAIYALMATMLPAAVRLADLYLSIQRAALPTQRLLELLDLPAEARSGALLSDRPLDGISLVGVSFRWPNRPSLLRGLNLEIPPGQVTALTGRSGSGKSSLIALLTREVEPTEGTIQTGARPVSELALDAYLQRIAVVPETTRLLAGSLRDNVLVGRPLGLLSTLREQILPLDLEKIVARFPNGWDTVLGDGASRISAGERQLVGFLRAIAGAPDLLVLDEALNTLDDPTAEEASQALRRYARQHAVLLVSHQQRTLATADVIYLLHDGKVVEADMAPRGPGHGSSQAAMPPARSCSGGL